MNERIILGIVYLLQSPEIENELILSYLVKACSYISLNFKFINSTISLRILQALVPISARLLSKPPSDSSRKKAAKDDSKESTMTFHASLTFG